MEAPYASKPQVVLFCLQLSKASKDPSLDSLKLSRLLSVFGKVKKVLIFKKKGMLKAFAEFAEGSAADQAVSGLNGFSLNDHGRIQIYLAHYRGINPSKEDFDVWEEGPSGTVSAPPPSQISKSSSFLARSSASSELRDSSKWEESLTLRADLTRLRKSQRELESLFFGFPSLEEACFSSDGSVAKFRVSEPSARPRLLKLLEAIRGLSSSFSPTPFNSLQSLIQSHAEYFDKSTKGLPHSNTSTSIASFPVTIEPRDTAKAPSEPAIRSGAKNSRPKIDSSPGL